jgi:hypothetical protein
MYFAHDGTAEVAWRPSGRLHALKVVRKESGATYNTAARAGTVEKKI